MVTDQPGRIAAPFPDSAGRGPAGPANCCRPTPRRPRRDGRRRRPHRPTPAVGPGQLPGRTARGHLGMVRPGRCVAQPRIRVAAHPDDPAVLAATTRTSPANSRSWPSFAGTREESTSPEPTRGMAPVQLPDVLRPDDQPARGKRLPQRANTSTGPPKAATPPSSATKAQPPATTSSTPTPDPSPTSTPPAAPSSTLPRLSVRRRLICTDDREDESRH